MKKLSIFVILILLTSCKNLLSPSGYGTFTFENWTEYKGTVEVVDSKGKSGGEWSFVPRSSPSKPAPNDFYLEAGRWTVKITVEPVSSKQNPARFVRSIDVPDNNETVRGTLKGSFNRNDRFIFDVDYMDNG
ncbi:MAG: hypothetical protein V1707_01050 [bacterium]